MTIPASTTVPGTTSKYAADVEVTSLLTAVRALLTAFVSEILAVANGGTGIGSFTAGDLIYATGATTLAKLAKQTDGQLLQLASGLPAWAGETSWTAPTFANSWVNVGGGDVNTAAYMKDANGFVHLRGHIKSGTLGATAFTLPSGYRPSGFQEFITRSYNAVPTDLHCVVEILTTGAVNVGVNSTGSNNFLALDGIQFDTR